MIQQEIHKSQQAQRFNLNSIPRHTHNSIDSPAVFQPTFTYAGEIGSDGTVGLLPQGWTAVKNGIGDFSIFHNLGTTLYSIVASAQQSTNIVVAATIESFENQIDFSWWNVQGTSVHAPADTSFTFLLTNISSKLTKFPIYYGSIVS